MPARIQPLPPNERPTFPLRFALIGTVALVAAFPSPAHADIVDTPDGYVVRSQANVGVGSQAQLTGSLGAAKLATLGSGAVVTGDVSMGTPHHWFTPMSTSDFPAAGMTNVSISNGRTLALDPGAYGILSAGSSAVLQLDPGQYVFSSFSLGNKGLVTADTSGGDVTLFVGSSLSAGSQTTFQNTGTGNLYILTLGDASFGSKSEINAFVYSYGAQSFGSSTELAGLTWAAGDVSIGSKSEFTYSAPVPAPGAMALLGIAGALALPRGRRHP